jgi:hypothetical protein
VTEARPDLEQQAISHPESPTYRSDRRDVWIGIALLVLALTLPPALAWLVWAL